VKQFTKLSYNHNNKDRRCQGLFLLLLLYSMAMSKWGWDGAFEAQRKCDEILRRKAEVWLQRLAQFKRLPVAGHDAIYASPVCKRLLERCTSLGFAMHQERHLWFGIQGRDILY
jgi:hypothetical protein